MQVKHDAVLGYGVICPNPSTIPWNERKFDWSLEEWWLQKKGFNPAMRPFTDEGDYSVGWEEEDPRLTDYFASRDEWLTLNPPPVSSWCYECRGQSVHVVIAPNSITLSKPYTPRLISETLLSNCERYKESLLTFLREQHIEFEEEPNWILMVR